MNLLFNNISKLLQLLIVLILISISLTGSDCEKILNNSGPVPTEMVGNWKLVEQTGALQDICPNENANFQSTGVAQLTCPEASSISRDFTVSNNVLTYTQTSVEYDVEFTNNNSKLALYGRNVSRNLKYERIITDIGSPDTNKKTRFNNSSETGR